MSATIRGPSGSNIQVLNNVSGVAIAISIPPAYFNKEHLPSLPVINFKLLLKSLGTLNAAVNPLGNELLSVNMGTNDDKAASDEVAVNKKHRSAGSYRSIIDELERKYCSSSAQVT